MNQQQPPSDLRDLPDSLLWANTKARRCERRAFAERPLLEGADRPLWKGTGNGVAPCGRGPGEWRARPCGGGGGGFEGPPPEQGRWPFDSLARFGDSEASVGTC